MRTRHHPIAVFVASAVAIAASAYSQPLPGTTGSAAGENWHSSWLGINPPQSFKKGETVRIRVEGNAENVVVRFLPANSPPSSSDGIEGNVRKVPAAKVLVVKLQGDHPNVKQISVHSGKEAWGTPLGGNNGTANLISVERSPQ